MVVGRDLHADLRIADPRISRAHLILRFDQGRWLAIDNGSLNGTYVNGYRMPVIDIHDGQSINVGNPQGPRLTFEIGPHQGQTSRPPQTRAAPDSGPPTLAWSAIPEQTIPDPAPRRSQPSAPHAAAQRRATAAAARRRRPPRHPVRRTRRRNSASPAAAARDTTPTSATVVNAGTLAKPARLRQPPNPP